MKFYLLSLFAIASIGMSAQTNLDLEAWTAGTGYDDPDGWSTLNQFSSFGLPVTVTKETVAPGGGTASAVMVTTLCTTCPSFGITDTLPGFIQQKVAYTDTTLLSVDFKYLYNAVSGDEGIAFIELTRWNGTSADVIAQGILNIADQATWTSGNVTMAYLAMGAPDSLSITFASSIAVFAQDYTFPQSQFGSELKVDDIILNTGYLGISSVSLERFNVYTSDNNILINTDALTTNTTIEVYNITGKQIISKQMTSTNVTIGTNGFTTGIYLVNISSENGVTTKRVYIK